MGKILVVDDEPFNLEIISEYLADAGCDLALHAEPEKAWAALQAEPEAYAIVVLDRMMPRLNGMEFLRRIKQTPALAHLPVVMQTAAASPEQVREGIEAGAYYYLTKPYEGKSLLSVVRAALADYSRQVRHKAYVATQSAVFELLREARFAFASLTDARQLAGFAAALCPQPETVELGLTELLVNAVEHGNLGISYATKAALKRDDTWEEEVARRLGLPEYRDKRAALTIRRDPDHILFRVEDEGPGFDWQRYLEIDPCRAFDPNGRGIALARMMSFPDLSYLGCGNVVEVRLPLPREAA